MVSFLWRGRSGENRLCMCKCMYSSEHRWRKMVEDCRHVSVGKKVMQQVLCRQVSSAGSYRAAHEL